MDLSEQEVSLTPVYFWIEKISSAPFQDHITRSKACECVEIILSRGLLEGKSSLVVEQTIHPHLQLLLAFQDDQIRSFHGIAQNLLDKLNRLASLPLFISHFDLNEVNIMISEECEVTGLIDWELSACLPFGMGFSRIHTLAGEFSARKFYMPPEFEDAERRF
jgi:thiamine kinase-like enzyme